MNSYLIKNATIVNEGSSFVGDLLVENGIIKKIGSSITTNSMTVIDASGKYLIPGLIDDQVHFREPGLTHKATIDSESRAAVAGGITTFIEMPNTVPQATNQQLLQDKFNIAEKTSYANYSFMFGGTNDNLEELLKTDPKTVAGIKLFLGSSTGNMLVDNLEVLEKIFSSTKLIISVHCEDEETIKKNTAEHKAQYGEHIPIELHPVIRSEEACYLSSSRAIELAKKTGARLHIFHLSTEKETHLFRNDIPIEEKQITAEVCVHHLWFSDEDYDENWSQNRLNISTLYRFSEQFSLALKSNHLNFKDDVGYLKTINQDIYFGRRDIRSVENNINLSYFFDSKKWINLRLRNYWSRAKYDQTLFRLKEDGKRTETDFSILDFDPDTNFNIWNLDINFEWWFAPGSNMVVLYRNQLFSRDNATELDYLKSLGNLFDQTTQHQFSLRINYLIDFNQIRK